MSSSRFNPADYPDGKGPRPPELLDDPLDVAVEENRARLDQAYAEVEACTRLAESRGVRGLRR